MCLGGPLQSILLARWELVEEEGQGEVEKHFQESLEVRPEEIKKPHRALRCDRSTPRTSDPCPFSLLLSLDVGAESSCS